VCIPPDVGGESVPKSSYSGANLGLRVLPLIVR
jgi:hypothetical protein